MEAKKLDFVVAEADLMKLREIIPSSGPLGPNVRALRARLEEAAVVPQAPRNVVALGSRFRMRDEETKAVGEYSLVLPNLADIARGNISVLAPIGALLLGAQERDTIVFTTPASTKRLRIESILHQP